MKNKEKHKYQEPHDTDLSGFGTGRLSAVKGRKGGSIVAGKDLSDTRSSHRKGRKSATTPKKLEKEAQ